jgi:hypothetical protein
MNKRLERDIKTILIELAVLWITAALIAVVHRMLS